MQKYQNLFSFSKMTPHSFIDCFAKQEVHICSFQFMHACVWFWGGICFFLLFHFLFLVDGSECMGVFKGGRLWPIQEMVWNFFICFLRELKRLCFLYFGVFSFFFFFRFFFFLELDSSCPMSICSYASWVGFFFVFFYWLFLCVCVLAFYYSFVWYFLWIFVLLFSLVGF